MKSSRSGRMAHSAYPHLGESAIEKLLDALERVRRIPLPQRSAAGREHAEHRHDSRRPRAERDSGSRAGGNFHPLGGRRRSPRARRSREAVAGLAEAREVLCMPALHLGALEGFETTVVSYTTDIPAFGGAWGSRS